MFFLTGFRRGNMDTVPKLKCNLTELLFPDDVKEMNQRNNMKVLDNICRDGCHVDSLSRENVLEFMELLTGMIIVKFDSEYFTFDSPEKLFERFEISKEENDNFFYTDCCEIRPKCFEEGVYCSPNTYFGIVNKFFPKAKDSEEGYTINE